MFFPSRHLHRTPGRTPGRCAFGAVQVSNLQTVKEIASSGKERPPCNDTQMLDSSRRTLYNLFNNAVRSRQPGMLVEKDGPG
jgi:hypothetical protein